MSGAVLSRVPDTNNLDGVRLKYRIACITKVHLQNLWLTDSSDQVLRQPLRLTMMRELGGLYKILKVLK
jgi:hypothetical protein